MALKKKPEARAESREAAQKPSRMPKGQTGTPQSRSPKQQAALNSKTEWQRRDRQRRALAKREELTRAPLSLCWAPLVVLASDPGTQGLLMTEEEELPHEGWEFPHDEEGVEGQMDELGAAPLTTPPSTSPPPPSLPPMSPPPPSPPPPSPPLPSPPLLSPPPPSRPPLSQPPPAIAITAKPAAAITAAPATLITATPEWVQTTLILQFPANLLEMLLKLCGVRGRTNLARTCHDVHAVRALQQMKAADAEERRQRVQDAFETRRAYPVGTLAWGSPLAHGALPRHLDDHELFVVVSCPKNSRDDFRLGWLREYDGQPLIIASIATGQLRKTCSMALRVGEHAHSLPPHLHHLEYDVVLLRKGHVAAVKHMFAKRHRSVMYSN